MQEQRIDHEDVSGLVERADHAPDEGVRQIHLEASGLSDAVANVTPGLFAEAMARTSLSSDSDRAEGERSPGIAIKPTDQARSSKRE